MLSEDKSQTCSQQIILSGHKLLLITFISNFFYYLFIYFYILALTRVVLTPSTIQWLWSCSVCLSILKASREPWLACFYLERQTNFELPLIIGINFHSNIDLTGSCILILVDLRRSNNQVEPSPVDCGGSWLKERLESICTSKRWQPLMIGSVLAQHVGRVSLKALCDSSLIGLLRSPSAVKCY